MVELRSLLKCLLAIGCGLPFVSVLHYLPRYLPRYLIGELRHGDFCPIAISTNSINDDAGLLPVNDTYGPWPASGEIDLAESKGNEVTYPDGRDTVSSTLHWGKPACPHTVFIFCYFDLLTGFPFVKSKQAPRPNSTRSGEPPMSSISAAPTSPGDSTPSVSNGRRITSSPGSTTRCTRYSTTGSPPPPCGRKVALRVRRSTDPCSRIPGFPRDGPTRLSISRSS